MVICEQRGLAEPLSVAAAVPGRRVGGDPEQMRMADMLRPHIARIWRGRTRRDRADDYEVYNYEAGIKPLIEKAMGVQTLREDLGDETEFVTISYWESIEAMSRFTGGDPTRIHHLDRDAEFLIELPTSVQILQIRSSHGTIGGERED